MKRTAPGYVMRALKAGEAKTLLNTRLAAPTRPRLIVRLTHNDFNLVKETVEAVPA